MKNYILFFFMLLRFGSNLQAENNNALPPSGQIACDICLVGGGCNQHFTLVPGQFYTFTTSTTAGAVYAWSVTGTGLVITGPRDQPTVQVLVTGGSGQICLSKSVNGEAPCCQCWTITAGTTCCEADFDAYYHCETDSPRPSRGGIARLVVGCDASLFSSITISLGSTATFLNAPYTGMQTITVYNPQNEHPWNAYLFQYTDCNTSTIIPHLRIEVTYVPADPACAPYTVVHDVEPQYGNENFVIENRSAVSNELKMAVQKVKFFPNPARTTLRFTNTANLVFTGIIYAADGRLVKQFNQAEKEIGIEALEKGVYFIRLYSQNGDKLLLTKFVKE